MCEVCTQYIVSHMKISDVSRACTFFICGNGTQYVLGIPISWCSSIPGTRDNKNKKFRGSGISRQINSININTDT